MLFVQHFLVIWFCVLHFFPGSTLLVKIRSIGAGWGCFDFWFLVFFCLGYFWWMFMWVWVCVYTVESKLEKLYLSSSFPQYKQIFRFVTSDFFLMHKINEKWINLGFQIWRDFVLESLVFICLVNTFFIHFSGFKLSWAIFTSFLLV